MIQPDALVTSGFVALAYVFYARHTFLLLYVIAIFLVALIALTALQTLRATFLVTPLLIQIVRQPCVVRPLDQPLCPTLEALATLCPRSVSTGSWAQRAYLLSPRSLKKLGCFV